MYRQASRQNNTNLFSALENDFSEEETNSGKGSTNPSQITNNSNNNSSSPQVVHPIFEQFGGGPGKKTNQITKPDKESFSRKGGNNSVGMNDLFERNDRNDRNDRNYDRNGDRNERHGERNGERNYDRNERNDRYQNQRYQNRGNNQHQQISHVPSTIQHKPPPVGEGENQLETPYTFWFTQRGRGAKNKPNTAGDFEQNIRYITTVSSVEQFWRVYTHLVQPNELNGRCDIHVFRYGIRPMWEDESNKEGGKWIVRLRKGFATRCWENLVLAMLGEQFLVGSEICGAVVSVRYHTEDIVSIWNKNANNQGVINQIRDIMKRVLNLPNNTIMEYKAHKESIKDASNRASVQREQAEQNIRQHRGGEREHNSPQNDRYNNSNGAGQFYD